MARGDRVGRLLARQKVGYASSSMAHACGHCGNHHEAYVTICPVTGALLGNAFVTEDEVLVGSIVAERYRVRDILGHGSTGTVFVTEHLGSARSAAMKVLRPRYASPDAVRHAFQGDTRVALGVTHPSLCEVFDVGTLPDGAPFFVMEHLEGDTLASRLGRERFSAAAAVDVMMQLLSAMDALHARQLLLRDLRPQNVFLAHRVGCQPVVKVLDIGLARLIPLERVQTEWNVLRAVTSASDVTGLLSIPYYLSPERARGELGVGPSSDIFVAAIILYEALTGQKPFTATSWHGLIQQITSARPTPLAVLRPDLPEDLGSLLRRALDADPHVRPPSAREMQDELRGVFDGSRCASAPLRAAPVAPASIDGTILARVNPVDEASADHPLRTAPPPRPVPAGPSGVTTATALNDLAIDVDVDVDDEEPAATSTETTPETTLAIPLARKQDNNDEDETAAMRLTPELRERIKRMTKIGSSSTPSALEDSSRPPPTRPLRPPRVR
jgi:serine/threonine protein kinase